MTNAINWFEIPVTNFERAKKFYSSVLDTEITDAPMPNMKYGVFKYAVNGVGGGIIEAEGCKPSKDGVTIYLPGGDDLSEPLARVEAAGGTIIIPKTGIGENGFMAQLIDTEGNRVALHSMN
ncbi:MAG: glyoxalase [Flavobacteriaceae bacterium]|nr:MAG: glyoxalase [Flavobacteriaceae bacterium]